MFTNKVIKDKNSRKYRRFYKLFKQNNVIILSKKELSHQNFQDMAKMVESDIHIGGTEYRGRTVLEIQLLAGLDSQEQITLLRIRQHAIVIIRNKSSIKIKKGS